MAWDNALGLGLLHMGARHYSPTLGRFLQPDPSAAEANLYGHGANSPVSRVDPSGLYAQLYRTENIEIPPWLADAAQAASGYVCGVLFTKIRHPWSEVPPR